jgi:FixJ family two-component response regulator
VLCDGTKPAYRWLRRKPWLSLRGLVYDLVLCIDTDAGTPARVRLLLDSPECVVFILDDDHGVCDALTALMSSYDIRSVAFHSAAEYMAYPKPDIPACLLLDVRLPDINGLELQTQFADSDHPQIVFITGHGDIPSSVRAMKAGAIDFLTKPLRAAELMSAIDAALEQNRITRRVKGEQSELRNRFSRLTPREKEVLPLVVSGLLNKQAAAELGISEITIRIHRGRIMEKMQAASLAELVRIAAILQVPMEYSRRQKYD